MIKTRYLRLFLILLLLCFGAGFSVVNAQQKRKEFTVLCKDRYFLGENPSIAILITNTGRSPKTVKEAEHQKFSLELTGPFSSTETEKKKELEYDGSIYYPPAREIHERIAWFEPTIRPAKYVTLRPGESTSVHFNLQWRFDDRMGVGKYRLTVKSEKGQKVVKDLEVYFDNEKTMPMLVKALEIEYDHSDRKLAIGYLWQFNRPKLLTSLEELAKSANPRQRDFATFMLWEIRVGNSDFLQLRVKNKERYSLNEAPTITVSLRSNLGTPQTVVEPQQQRFFLELRRTLLNESTHETKTCVYTPKESPRKPKLVTIPRYGDVASLTLNLQECFGARLEAGNYELIVKGLDQEELKYQVAVQKFQIIAGN